MPIVRRAGALHQDVAVGRVAAPCREMEDDMVFHYGIVPQSVIARRSSGLSRKSRKPVLWMPT